MAAGKSMTKSEIAATVAEKVGITKKQAVQVFEVMSELAYKQAKNNFVIPGLGKVVLRKSARAKWSCSSARRRVRPSRSPPRPA
ncbi:MAG: HU family DNA-binding protein [Tepidisphaeraceae bacterium]